MPVSVSSSRLIYDALKGVGVRVVSAPGRHQFYSVRIENGVAVPAFKASGDITSMSQADGYIEIEAEVETMEAGTMVEVKLL